MRLIGKPSRGADVEARCRTCDKRRKGADYVVNRRPSGERRVLRVREIADRRVLDATAPARRSLMRRIAACNISLALAIFIGATELAAAQNTHMGMAMARTTL